MKSSLFSFLIWGLLALTSFVSFGQNTSNILSDSLIKKFEYYRSKKQGDVLFAHFDKTIYTNNENVWFTAYLLNDTIKRKNDVLSVILVKDDDRSTVLDSKFVMTNGISPGNLFLPDTIAAGNYSFMLYTNNVSNGKPADVFIQPITIKNTTETSFNAFLSLLDTGKFPANGKRRVLLVSDARGPKIISDAVVDYYAGSKLRPIVSGKVKTDKAGQFLFDIPANDVSIDNNVMEARLTWGKETKTVKLMLPINNVTPTVKFYPEGGNLSEGIKSIVGWEVKDRAANPYKVTGVLYKDGTPVDTINTNSYGMGKFSIRPSQKSTYYIKLLLESCKDSIYYLPKIQTDLPVINIANALADDTLQMVIKNKVETTVSIVVHNYRQMFFSFPVVVSSTEKKIKIDLSGIPKGIAEITVLDSLQRPCAERLFFAHYKERNSLIVNTDKSEYKKRQQVHLKLKLADPDGKPIAGIVSIACVQANRVELKKAKSIESYFYLEHELGSLPVTDQYFANNDQGKTYLEDILLIKGWRRYNWKDLIETTASDTLSQWDSLAFKGKVTLYGKPLTKSATLILFNDSIVNTISTTSIGAFKLANNYLYINQDKKIYLVIAGKYPDGYTVDLNDPYQNIDRNLIRNYSPLNYTYLRHENGDNSSNLNRMEHIIRLTEVKINALNNNTIYGKSGSGPNACGDYVCRFNILNCPNHRDESDNRPPKKGYFYTYQGKSLYLYGGCEIDVPTAYRKNIDGIKYSVEYYPSDYSVVNPSAPDYVSTVYWKHLYKITPGTDQEINFFTSDITGEFKIIVQGITGDDVVYAEKSFNVTKP